MRWLSLAILLLVSVASFAQPYQPQVIWDRSGLQDSSSYGYEILPLGDQNDDGYADWAVLAFGNIPTWHGTQRPYLEFFHGGATPSTAPYFVFQQDSPAYYQSWSAWVIGDLNGDGYRDWMTDYWPQGFPPYRVYGIFLGGHGPSATPDLTWPLSVVTRFYPLTGFDFNGDGYDDLFWRGADNGDVRVYYGGSPFDTTADWVRYQLPPGMNSPYPAATGDFNGDGASDFICYNPNNGQLDIFLGGATPDTLPDYVWANAFEPLGGVKSLNGDAADEFLLDLGVHFGRDSLQAAPDAVLNSEAGHQAVGAGDFNHDGFNDLILLTPTTGSNMFGALDLHLGGQWLYPNPVFEIQGSWPNGLIGIYTAAGLGDVNGDGIDDFAIGAWDDFAYLGWRGRCVIIGGDSSLQVSAEEPRPEIPDRLEVSVYPNPFNGQTTIRIDIPSIGEPVALTVFNLLGQVVREEMLPSFLGECVYHFDGSELTTGLYLVHVESVGFQKTEKIMLLR